MLLTAQQIERGASHDTGSQSADLIKQCKTSASDDFPSVPLQILQFHFAMPCKTLYSLNCVWLRYSAKGPMILIYFRDISSSSKRYSIKPCSTNQPITPVKRDGCNLSHVCL